VVNNYMSSAQLFENQLCTGRSLAVDLAWPESRNTRAIGARIMLHTSTGTYQRTVRSNSGYLSGDPARVHFGLPEESKLIRLTIEWPDGAISTVSQLSAQTIMTISR